MPFIIRGVKLWGINSVNTSKKRREFIWNEASKLINFNKLEESIKIINLEELLDIYPKMLQGKTSGRYIIDLNKYWIGINLKFFMLLLLLEALQKLLQF